MLNKNVDNTPCTPEPVDTGEAALDELCSDNDHSDAEMKEDYFDQLKRVFSNVNKIRIAHQYLAVSSTLCLFVGLEKIEKNHDCFISNLLK